MSRHTDLIDAVNEAKTELEHSYAEAFLAGWRAGQEEAGRSWSLISATIYTEEKFPGRPNCGGVLIDWKPEAATHPKETPNG